MSTPSSHSASEHRENRLRHETSPYLRQHMHHPVDWWPWGREAFAEAEVSDRPILLSIGYSACHWCHVMAHESFEDAETAVQLNRDFVNIKVDREEHPDVDQLYQHALQILGGNGGWPLTMFLLPTGEPFYGGTYFPPREAFGRPSFRRVLDAVKAAFISDRARLIDQAEQLRTALHELESRGAGTASQPLSATPESGLEPRLRDLRSELGPTMLGRACARLASRIDRREGGFVGAPKFPNPTVMSLFLRSYGRTRDRADAEPALLTLSKMAAGGIYDQLGGGFARYSTDAVWRVPHFEKMLYDNAQLLRLYAEAYCIHVAHGEVAEASRCAEVVVETHGWLEREMRDQAGGFFAAQDADSEGVEGKFFLWTPEQLEAILPPDEARLFARCYGVRPGGNVPDPHGHTPPGSSVLHVAEQPQGADEAARLAEARARLFAARAGRIPPGTDDKVLCGWNGLAVTGLAEAGRLLDSAPLVTTAKRVADFLLSSMYEANQGQSSPPASLRRTYKGGQAKLPATLDDHAFLAEGLFHLAFAARDLGYLRWARQLTDDMLRQFYDRERGLFYLGLGESDGVRLPIRPVSYTDSAIPSGLSVACMNLLRLSGLFASSAGAPMPEVVRYREIAERVLGQLAEPATRSPLGLSNVCAAIDLLTHGLSVTVIVDPQLSASDEPSPSAATLLRAANTGYVPDHAVLLCHPDRPLPDGLDHHRSGKRASPGQAVAYVCRGPTCSAPIVDPQALRRHLGSPWLVR